MAKVIYIDDNGGETVLREGSFGANNVLFRDNYIATKLWEIGDIEERMEELGYTVTPERVRKVVDSCSWRFLGDCREDDWLCIDEQIEMTLGEPDVEEKEGGMKEYWDRDFYSINEYSGRKYIHIHGYFYDNSDVVDIKSREETSRQLDYAGLLIPLDMFLEWDRDTYDAVTGDCTQATGIMTPFTAVWTMNYYFDAAPPKELPYTELTLDTPCGHYVDDGVKFDWR